MNELNAKEEVEKKIQKQNKRVRILQPKQNNFVNRGDFVCVFHSVLKSNRNFRKCFTFCD